MMDPTAKNGAHVIKRDDDEQEKVESFGRDSHLFQIPETQVQERAQPIAIIDH